ncbi:peptidyl-glycine alpha-amidating monooxygenase B-like isoform X1 [Eriocheir sinensis]|nr:peptidyl-glycine alpha-amidating monooxygenase B-like isoform X1 [Eriocheir sinensis]XP_050701951.1 peptidyl-glycine alpha-amidating monooxygenase B-like isoform X1 [Eriocheir sinensis]XP_050701952.1 peptidyl-glycine alpha-amidating monooxygenase B-like isoform X1 [Eriocheir sinensis]XP_050701953.1 peptidyl-glycine alpha-amidating monooxygenase B-like isoform X1 [Eriocheir sinensis]
MTSVRAPCVLAVLGVALAAALPRAAAHSFTRRGEPSAPAAANTLVTKAETYFRNFTMPGITPKEDEAYLCTAQRLNESVEEWVMRFDPLASANRAHHMLLFGCSDVRAGHTEGEVWDCGHHGVCEGSRIMYAWAKNAPTTSLPPNVGFRIGGQTGIRFLTLQIHYAKALPEGVLDHSGLQMELTHQQQKYKAGIYLLAAGNTVIPPHAPKTHADMNCLLKETNEPQDIHLFAYRVHAHVLGTVITGYLFDTTRNEYTEIAKGNPHWPQAFYPMNTTYLAKTSDIIHARCTWDSTTRNRMTMIGSTAKDEMCNLYLMYFTDREAGSEFGMCGIETYQIITKNLPPDSDVPLPPNPLLEEHAQGENKHKVKGQEGSSKAPSTKEKAFTYSVPGDQEIKLEKKGHPHHFLQNYENSYDDYIDEYRKHSRQQQLPLGLEPVRISDAGYRDNTRYQSKPSGYDYEDATNYPQPQQILQRYKGPADTPQPALLEVPREGKQLKISAFRTLASWGQKEVPYGQVVAVALDSDGDVVVFHRGEHAWDGSTFTAGNVLRNKKDVITQPTLLHLKKDTGEILHKWGENFFFMPHGLTLDKDNNIWVTDVGLHQVFKFPAGYGDGKPLLTLGTRFQPGSDNTHFCKPTGVAVMSSGEFFVSDGYCNARVIKYSADGKILLQFGKPMPQNFLGLRSSSPAPTTFNIPHALTLADHEGEVCVADRENGRIQCFTTALGKFARQFKFDAWGNRLFSMSYTPASGGKIFAVNGPWMLGMHKEMVFEVDYTSGELLGAFSPNGEGLSNPHDIVVSPDGRVVYVAEIGPNRLWKFENSSAIKPEAKALSASKLTPSPVKAEESHEAPAKAGHPSLLYIANWSSVGVSTVVLGLLTIPIIVLTVLTLIIRARRTGRLNVHNMNNGSLGSLLRHPRKRDKGLNIGSLINKHHGFEKLATEDLDHDAPDSGDSDIEEFSQVASRA